MEGYEFAGFKTSDGRDFDVTDAIVSDLTLYARFRKTETDETSGGTTVSEKCADGTSVDKTTVIDENGNTTTTTETTDSSGNTTTVKVEETQNDDGSITTVTTTTDASGNTNSETTTDTSSAHYWVMKGISELLKIGESDNTSLFITNAKTYFEKAYEVDPNDDEAKVYSALCNLADIATSKKIGDFFKDHLGLTNYPSTLSSLISGSWLSEAEYVEYKESVDAYEMRLVTAPVEGQYYYFKASPASDGIYHPEYVSTTIPGGEGLYVYYRDENRYRNEYSDERLKLDENGEYYIYKYYSVYNTELPYERVYSKDVTYDRMTEAPKFNTNFEGNWISSSAESGLAIQYLVLANVLEGNSNGLNDAIDDLYAALFSDEYSAACAKIDAVSSGVSVPAKVIKAFGLDETFGSSSITLGKTELKLVESALNVFKFALEYLQGTNFDMDLSFLKVNWPETFSDQEAMMNFINDNFGSYNAARDPIACNFLGIRDASKIATSKATLLSIVDDVTAAYTEITKASSTYPSAIKTALVGEDGKQGKLLLEGAVQLKAALTNGTKLYIPTELFNSDEALPETWPVSGDEWIDMGMVFTPGLLSIKNIIELNAQNKPVFYKMTRNSEDGSYVINGVISNAEEFKAVLQNSESGESAVMKLKLYDSISNLLGINLDNGNPYLDMGYISAFIFNFYYGGLEDVLSGE